jgi:hypothetical protein
MTAVKLHDELLPATFPAQSKAFKFAYYCVRVARVRDPLVKAKVTRVEGKWRVIMQRGTK